MPWPFDSRFGRSDPAAFLFPHAARPCASAIGMLVWDFDLFDLLIFLEFFDGMGSEMLEHPVEILALVYSLRQQSIVLTQRCLLLSLS